MREGDLGLDVAGDQRAILENLAHARRTEGVAKENGIIDSGCHGTSLWFAGDYAARIPTAPAA